MFEILIWKQNNLSAKQDSHNVISNKIKMPYIKNPLNYHWAKNKLFDQIFPLFPKNINTFVDLFGWSWEVWLNSKSKKIIYNEKNNGVFEILQEMRDNQDFVKQVDEYIKKYQLSKTNQDWYLRAKSDYNDDLVKDPVLLYVLVCHSFANQIRFNRKFEFNLPFGLRTFNEVMRANIYIYIYRLQQTNIEILNKDFIDVNLDKIWSDDFVYLDPPYLVTIATYNENWGWNETREKQMYKLIDDLDKRWVKFALSNVIDHKWKSNDMLKEWAKKYNMYLLDKNYSNCNYQTKNRDKTTTQEVLITNY